VKECSVPSGDGREGETRLRIQTRIINLTRYPIIVAAYWAGDRLYLNVREDNWPRALDHLNVAGDHA